MIVGVILLAAASYAVPGLISYQGQLSDTDKQPITAPVNLTFTFWDAESGGNPLGSGFSDMDTVNPDTNGLFTTLIGDDPGNLVPASVFSGESVWLNINIGGFNLSPRQRIVTVGYAAKASQADMATTAVTAMNAINALNAHLAANADMVDDKHASDFAAAAHGHNLQDLPGAVTDAQVPNSITINHAASADTATNATNAVNAGNADTVDARHASEFADFKHGHNLQDLSGAVTDAQVPNTITINHAASADTATDASNATKAGNADTVDDMHASDFAAAKHGHNLQDLPGAVTDAQVPNNITINYAATAGTASTASTASGLSGALSVPGNRIALGTNVWLEAGANGRLFLSAGGQQLALPLGRWTHPAGILDNISPDGEHTLVSKVAMDNNGNTIIVWEQSDGSKSRIFKSEYRGGVWTHPGALSDNISPDGQPALDPKVAMDNNGNTIIVWEQSDGSKSQIFKSEYRGGVWTHPGALSDNISPDGQTAYYPQVAMDDNGNAIICWYQNDGSRYQIFKSEYRGGVWTHPGGLSDNISPDGQDAYGVQVEMDNNGNAIICWQQSDGSVDQIFKSEYRGGIWTHPGGLSDNISPDGETADGVQVAMDNNGNAIICWQQSDGSKQQIFKSEYRGGVWTYPGGLSDNISPDGQNGNDPQAAVDNNGNAIIVWHQNDGSNNQIFKSEYRGGVWKHPGGLSDNISPDGQNAYSQPAAMDDNGNAIICWHQSDGSRSQVFKSEYRGGVWTHPAGLSDNISPDVKSANSPQVAMDNNGNAIICWQQSDDSNNQIFKSEYRFR